MIGSPQRAEASGSFSWGVAGSVFAGLLGAGVVDGAAVLARGAGAAADVLALALGIYGTAGLVAGVLAGWAAGATLSAIPGGAGRLRDDPGLDDVLAGAIVAGLVGAVVVAIGAAAAQGVFVGQMASKRLAVIATAGIALALCPVGVVAALAVRRPARWTARLVPRPHAVGRTGLLLILLVLAGALAAAAALSRADWRVLDLGPLEALGVAVVLGLAHGLFWHVWSGGRRLGARMPRPAIRVIAALLSLALLVWGARVPDSSPAYQAINDNALGLRFGLKVARALTDRDGDGYSARFGGGDCDDHRADTYPGAEDIPGDGIDQNCEGGDAKGTSTAVTTAPKAAVPLTPIKPAAGAFTGNILLITIDALRGDRLGVAGYGRPKGRSLTPNLDALAKRGAYFRRVWSQAPNTPRSFPAIVTSRYPSEIDWQQRSLNYSPILPSNQTFFEWLARAGLKPIGIFSHFYFTADRGISKAFAEWSNDGAGTIAESNKDIAAPRIVPRVIARLEKAATSRERFVLWTHLFEPHSSYMEHKEYPVHEKGIAGLEEKYDYEIAFVDLWIAKILATLKSTGLDKNTAVVVAADHGEAWGEHKKYFHGQDLTEEQLRVPLIIAIPGHAPVVAEDEVALVDLGPTLLDLVGVPAPPAFHGRSLLPRVDGKPLEPRPIFAELLPANAWPKHEVMMVDRGRKITHRITDRHYDLHDLRHDPQQQRNLADDPAHAKLLEELKAKLLAFEEGKR
jgi:arylsulfatase A-like enzyme